MASSETVVVDDEAHGETEAGTTANGGAEHDTGAFPPFDSTTFASQLLWLAITFVALYFLMAKVALPRIAGILENRRDRIASDLDMAGRLKTESDEAIAAYEQALGAARAKSSAIAETARQEARHAADEERAAIEDNLATKLAEAETRIGEIKAQALHEVGSIAAGATGMILTALVGIKAPAAEIEEAVAGAMKEGQDNAV
ncbi:MAG: F0F1 ATP synthase subunit B [Alphaproteobacteria bacterium]